MREFVSASNGLTARWARHACAGESTAVSGAGLWPLLALLAATAREPGRGELRAAIGIDADGAERQALRFLKLLDGSTAAACALGVWTRAGLPLEPWWLNAVPAALCGELGGDPAADQQRLDAWVQRRTGGRLTAMPVRIDPATLMVLATALSIDTRWREPFQNTPVSPQEGPWAGRAGKVAGLTRTSGDIDQLVLAETPAGPLTQLIVQGEDDIDVHLCLGEPGRPGGDVVAESIAAVDGHHPAYQGAALLDPAIAGRAPGVELRTITAFDPRPTLATSIVRFDVTADHDLLKRPELFGLAAVSAEDPRGHFPGISGYPLAVSKAVQDLSATFSAAGFKAAVVTAISLAPGGAPPVPTAEAKLLRLEIDRPFGFFARHRPTGLILLAGWIVEPEGWPDGVPELAW